MQFHPLLTCILIWLWNFLRASSTSRFDKSISLHSDFKIFFVFSVPLPRNSPRTCRLIPFRVTRKFAMTFGLSATNECLIRNDKPFSGFLLNRFRPIRYILFRTSSLFDGGSPDWTQLLLWRRLKIFYNRRNKTGWYRTKRFGPDSRARPAKFRNLGPNQTRNEKILKSRTNSDQERMGQKSDQSGLGTRKILEAGTGPGPRRISKSRTGPGPTKF